MKKLVLIFTFVLFTSFGFANTTIVNANSSRTEMFPDPCVLYAISSVASEIEYYGYVDDVLDSFEWYYDACEGSGGSIVPPVFVGEE